MSSSFDDRRGRLPPPRPPARPNPNIQPVREDAPTYDPRRADPRRVPIEPVTGPPTFDYDPTLRTGRPQQQTYERLVPDYMSDPADIEPPVDTALADAFEQTMGRPGAADRHGRRGDFDISPPLPERVPQPRPVRHDDTELHVPSRTQSVAVAVPTHTAIVPPGSVTGRSLNLVIVIMCFLACLTAGAVYMMNQSAAAWLKDIASEVTVQVEAREKTDVDRTVAAVAKFLQQQPGIRGVKILSSAENAELLEPWLGQMEALRTLPVPRLIALEIDRSAPPNLTAMRTQIANQFRGVSLDDHRQWQQQIRTVTRSFALGGLAILMLVGAATTAIIVSATRAALAANREIVEVLHFIGATDRFIAREFEKHFLRLGVRAGILGAVAAMLVFLALPFVMELLGGGTVTMAEMRRMIGSGALDWSGYLLLGVVVAVVAALCMLTSRIGVYRILHSQH
jgi:cell division transport system permease protein